MTKAKKKIDAPATTAEWAEQTVRTIKEQLKILDPISIQVLGDALSLIDAIPVKEDRSGDGPIYTAQAVLDAVEAVKNSDEQENLMKLTLALNSTLVVGLYDNTIAYISKELDEQAAAEEAEEEPVDVVEVKQEEDKGE